MGFFDSLFGIGTSKASKEGQRQQLAQNRLSQGFTRDMLNRSRQDLFNLGIAAMNTARGGDEQALSVLQNALTPSIDAFTQGNVQAQETLLAGMPQRQAAILGLPMDLSGLQARSVDFDASPITSANLPISRAERVTEIRSRPNRNAREANALFNLFGGGV